MVSPNSTLSNPIEIKEREGVLRNICQCLIFTFPLLGPEEYYLYLTNTLGELIKRCAQLQFLIGRTISVHVHQYTFEIFNIQTVLQTMPYSTR